MLDFLNDSEYDYFSNPKRFANDLGITDSYDTSSPLEQRNYLDDNFGNFAGKLPIDEPSGSIVSGGREDLYHKYSQMLEQEPESRRILDDYMGRRPTFDQYKPGLGKRLGSAAIGIAEGMRTGSPMAAFRASQTIADDPFNRAMYEYEKEGKFIDDAMKVADSSRNQQLAGILNTIRQQELGQYRQQQIQSRQDTLRSQQSRNDQMNADREADNARQERQFQETQRHNRAMELKSLHGGNDTTGDKLNPFQKQGMKTYEQLTKPDDKMAERKMRSLIAQDPSLASLFQDTSDASTFEERNRLVPRADLNPIQRMMLQNLIEKSQLDDRLLNSLGFGE